MLIGRPNVPVRLIYIDVAAYDTMSEQISFFFLYNSQLLGRGSPRCRLVELSVQGEARTVG